MKHEISIEKIEYESVSVNEKQMFDIAIKVLENKFGIPDCPSVDKDDNLTTEYEQCGGSHCWFTTDVVRKATELDRSVLEILKILHTHELKKDYDGL